MSHPHSSPTPSSAPPNGEVLSYYDHFCRNLLPPNEKSYMNLGYWKDGPATLTDACDALVQLLGDRAGFPRGGTTRCDVLDVGCGLGEQDVHWAEIFNVGITALDLNPTHVERTKQLVEARGVSDRVQVREGSATELTNVFGQRKFDKVVALESAFHFRSRYRFFGEAFEVLKPGGVLATADVAFVPAPGAPLKEFVQTISLDAVCTQRENRCTSDMYKKQLEATGFVDVGILSIGAWVWQPFWTYLSRMVQGFCAAGMPPNYALLPFMGAGGVDLFLRAALPGMALIGLLANPLLTPWVLSLIPAYSPEYIIATARKP